LDILSILSEELPEEQANSLKKINNWLKGLPARRTMCVDSKDLVNIINAVVYLDQKLASTKAYYEL